MFQVFLQEHKLLTLQTIPKETNIHRLGFFQKAYQQNNLEKEDDLQPNFL